MADRYVSNPEVRHTYGFDADSAFEDVFSMVSIESLLFNEVAAAGWTLESLFDLFRSEVEWQLSELKPHTLRWYANKAKAFRFWQALIPETDRYDDTGMTEEQIEATQVVKHAAAVEGGEVDQFRLLIKVAGESDGNLSPLTGQQLTALSDYFKKVKDAGVKLDITSSNADDLTGYIRIYYNPMVMASDGMLLAGGGSPVRTAIDGYLRNLPFNGLFTVMALTDAIQRAAGVDIVQVVDLYSRQAQVPYTTVVDRLTPYAGYMRVPSYSAADDHYMKIEYIANE
jgi:hypothetical protein